VLRYQFHRLLWRNDIVSVLGSDGPRLCRVHDGIKHHWIETLRKQNPLILGQVLEQQTLFVSSGVVFWKYSVKRSRGRPAAGIPEPDERDAGNVSLGPFSYIPSHIEVLCPQRNNPRSD
jgi:hypothetical protein